MLNTVIDGPIYNKSVLVQVMSWRQTGDKPIIWTNADSVHGIVYAALEENELRPAMGRKVWCLFFLWHPYATNIVITQIYVIILYPTRQSQVPKINQPLNLHQTAHIAPSQASYGVSFVNIWKNIDRVM